MIKIDYNDGIKIDTEDLSKIFSEEELPLKIEIKNVVSKKIVWTTHLSSHMWAIFPNNEMYDVIIRDKYEKFIYHYYWDVIIHGSIFYKSLWLYCKNLINQDKKPNGLVIGTHDGEFGEWCPLVRHHLSEMVLVEGSKNQFEVLQQNYEGKDGLTFVNRIVTEEGGNVKFFEGGKGYTNSVVERVIRKWESEEIGSSYKESISINNLIETYFINCGKKLDWLHLDVEGLDAKLILAIKKDYLPNFIIYEDANLLEDEKTLLMNYLIVNGYTNYSNSGICMSTKLV
jgi:hypothetical protein